MSFFQDFYNTIIKPTAEALGSPGAQAGKNLNEFNQQNLAAQKANTTQFHQDHPNGASPVAVLSNAAQFSASQVPSFFGTFFKSGAQGAPLFAPELKVLKVGEAASPLLQAGAKAVNNFIPGAATSVGASVATGDTDLGHIFKTALEQGAFNAGGSLLLPGAKAGVKQAVKELPAETVHAAGPETPPSFFDKPIPGSERTTVKPTAEATKVPVAEPVKPVEPVKTLEFTPGLTKALKDGPPEVIDAFKNWTNARGAAELEAVKAKEPFKNLDTEGTAAFDKIQSGDKTGAYGQISDYFKGKEQQLKDAGIKQGHIENYLPQIWKDAPAKVEKVFSDFSGTARSKPGFTKERIISDYKTGIEKGLTPKYDKVSDLVGWYEHTANKAIADKQFLDQMKTSGKLVESAKAPAGWKAVNPDYLPGPVFKAEPALAKAINNYLGQGSPSGRVVSGFVGRIKGIVLGAGIPKTGLNYHGVSIFVRSLLAAKNPLSEGLNTGTWLVHPASAEKFFNENLDKAIEFRKSGLTVSSEEHAFAREAKQVEGNIIKKAANKVSEKQQSWFEDPLFGKVVPALKLRYADSLTQDLVKSGKTREEAMKIASKSTNDLFGGQNLDELTRSKNFQQILRSVILAPDWLETQSNIAKGIVKGTLKLNDPQYQAYRRVGRNLLVAYIAANIANKLTSGHWMFQNGPKDQFSVSAGQDSTGKDRYVKVFGGAVDFAKLPYEMIQGIATGDASAIGSIFRNRLSGPAGVALDVLSNTNPAKGNTPLFGKDQYGNAQSGGTQLGNFATILAGAVLPQQAQAASQAVQGKAGLEQTLAQALEAPITYRSKPKAKSSGSRKVSTGGRSRKGRAPKTVKIKKTRTTRISTKRPKKIKV